MARPTTLFDLPTNILVYTLFQIDDIASLLNAESVCRDFYRLMPDVWRKLFLAQYDDPRRAAAFLVPRSQIAWKQRYIDRKWAFDYLSQEYRLPEIPAAPGDEETERLLASCAPRLCRTVLDLYLDLPPQGEASLNLPIIVSLTRVKVLAFILRTSNLAEANRLEALFNCLPSFRNTDPDRYLHAEQRRWGWKGLRYWDGTRFTHYNFWESTAAGAPAATANTLLQPYERYLQGYVPGEDIPFFESRRGRALSLLRRGHPLDLPTDKVWDWAGVGGSWYGAVSKRTWWGGTGMVSKCILQPLSLVVVPARSDVAQAYSDVFGKPRLEDLWEGFDDLDDPDMATGPSHPLQPLFFYGTCFRSELFADLSHPSQRFQIHPQGQSSASQAPPLAAGPPGVAPITVIEGDNLFIHGVAHLHVYPNPDTPPQVRFTLTFTSWDQEKRILWRAVEPWGPQSGGGVLGTFYYYYGGYAHSWPDGFMWLWRERLPDRSPSPV